MMTAEKSIRDYILNNFLFTEDESALGNEDSFLEKGIIDSTGVLELITFLEDEFELVVEDEEMVPENLDSVTRLTAFINKKREQKD